MKNRKSFNAKLRSFVSPKPNSEKSTSSQPTQLAIETLEERMMLSGTSETLIFSAGFEDVVSGEFTAVAETSEFTAPGNSVEVQDNVGGIGGDSEDLILQFESTDISPTANAITIDGGTGGDAIVGSDLGPVLEIQGDNFVQQDSEYVLSLPTTNQGQAITRWIINWGDGTEPESIAGNPDAATHTYSEVGNYTVSAQGFDENSLQNVAGSTLQVKARGSEGGETFQILVDDNIVGSFTTSESDQIFTVESDQPLTPDQIKIKFTNDLYDPDNGIDRNLIVDYIDIDGAKYQTEAPNVFSTGTWKPEDGIQPGFRDSQVLHGNGIFQFDATEGSTVEVIARGSEGNEQFNLLVDDVVVETFAVTQEYASYAWSSPQDVSAKQIRVEFVNDIYDPANGIDSNLHVDRVQIDGVRFETESDDVFSTGTWKPEDGIQPGLRNSQTLHSNGYFQFDSTRANGDLVPYLSNLLNVEVQTQPSVLLPNIDFEFSGSQLPLNSGDVIAEQFAALGVHVSTLDSNHPAMIFDSSRPTGGDLDLGTSNSVFGGPGIGAAGSGGAGLNDQSLRNILIISEDGDSTDPDDNANGGTLVFDFDDPVMLDEIGLLDIENDETEIRVYDIDGNVIDQIDVNGRGDNSFQLVSIDAIGVARLEIELAGSGAVTELVFSRDGQPISPLPTAFYTVDEHSDQGFHYNETGDQVNDFDLVDGQRARGATTTDDGNPVWVLKSNENVYVYDRVNNSFLGEWDAVGPEWGRGIGTDGTDIWIVDAYSDQVFFYENGAQHTSGSHTASSSFELQASNYDPSGLVVQGDTIWVTDAKSDKVFVYDRAGNALGDWSLDSRNSKSSGITINAEGTHLWVTDFDDGAIYFYEDAASVTSGSLTATSTIDLGSNNSRPGGIAGTPPSPFVDNAPTIAPIATQNVDEGESLSVTATATDADLPKDQLTFSILSGPDGLVIDSATGEIVFTPTEAQGPDVYSVTVGVSDSDGLTDQTSFDINVGEVNLPPVLAPIANQSITAGESIAFTATATDPDLPANTLTYSLGANAPAGATIAPSTGEFLYTTDPADGDATLAVDVIVTDEGGLTDSQTVAIVVTAIIINLPVIDPIATQTVDEGEELSVTAVATDADLPNDQLTYSILSGPDGLTIDSATGEIVWTPTEAQGPDVYSVTVGVSDSDGNTSDTTFEINVGEVNLPPVLAPIADQTTSVGESVSFTATATDPDLPANTLTFSLGANAPAGATIDAATGQFSFTPTAVNAGSTLEADVIVTDEGGLTDSQTVSIVVAAIVVNGPALAPIATQTVDEGDVLSVTATATDADLPNDQLTFSILSGADGLTIDSDTGEIVWTPTEAQGPGVYSVVVGVSDSDGNTADTTFDVQVGGVNLPPVLAPIADQTTSVGESVSFTATATDPDLPANTLTFSLGANAPAGATIDAATGQFLFTPTAVNAGSTLEADVIVTDEGGLTDSQTVSIVVAAIVVNGPALAPIATQTVDEGDALSVTATATDADLPNDQLTFSILSGPDGLTIDSDTGEIVWTPTEAQGPDVYSVTVGVSDSDGNTSDTTFDVQVAEVNAPPVLAPIADRTITAGQPVSFTATATDPDLPTNTLTFSLGANAPVGATIDATTGAFLWTTSSADGAASFAVDVIVTDEGGLADSQTVTINVTQIPVGISVTAGLTRDTARGGVNNDLITSDPSIEGAVTTDATTPITTLFAGLTAGTLVDVSFAINPDGSFALTESQLEQVNGGPLADGQTTVFLQATDEDGNSSPVTEFTFELDKTAPVLAADLTAATDTGVIGDRTTETAIVDVSLTTEASAALFAGGTNALQANSAGEAVVQDVALDIGDNVASYAAVDIAGNTNVIDETFTRVALTNQPNQDPEFISDPDLLFQIPGQPNDPVGEVTPQLLDLDLSDLPLTQNVSIRIPTEDVSTAFADIIFVVDESGSLAGEQAFIGPVVEQINAALEERGIGPNRFALVGFTSDARIFDANAGTNVQVFNASGQEIDDYDVGAFNDLREIALTANQEYLLLIDNESPDGIAGTDFEVFLAETEQQELAAGVNAGAISQPAQRQQFDFTVDAYDSFLFDSLTNNNTLRWSIEGPTGAVVSNVLFTNSDGGARVPIYNLAPGEYSLVVDGIADSTGDFAFSFESISTATALTPGTPVIGEFTTPTETLAFRFDATAGDEFFVDVIETSDTRSVFVRLIDPFGVQAASASTLVDIDTLTAEFTGTYTLLLESRITNGQEIDTFQINVVPVNDLVQTLVLGQDNAGSIAIGQVDQYSFEVTDRGNVYFDSQTNLSTVRWTLTGPEGVVVNSRAFNGSDAGTGNGVINLAAGSYLLTVDGVGDNVVDYGFRLLDLASATAIGLDTDVSGQLTAINQSDAYQFNATAGDEILVRFPEASDFRGSAYRVVASDGRLITFNRNLVDSPPIVLNQTGTYTLLIEPGVGNAPDVIDTYTVNVELLGNTPIVPVVGTAVTFDTVFNGEISADAEIDTFTFTLNEQSLVYLDSLVNTSLRWTLTGPAGTVVNARRLDQTDSFNGFMPQDLPAGDYQLLINGAANQTGPYGFRLLDLSTATEVTPGTPFAGELTSPTQTDIYQFDAAAGDLVYFDVVNTSDSRNATFRLIDVYGSQLFRSNRLNDGEPVELEEGGTYILLVEGALTNEDADTYELNIVPVSQTTTALTLGAVTNGAIDNQGDTRTYAFDVASYGLYYLDSLTDERDLRLQLASQSATLFSNRPFDDADSFDNNSVIALAPGSYELTVDGLASFTGDFSFRFSPTSTATTIVPGTPIDVTLETPAETKAFQFDAAAGDQVYLDVVSPPTGNGNFWYSLFDPNGTRLAFTRSLGDTDTLLLEAEGTYTLLVEGRVDSIESESFSINVAPVSAPVSTPLAIGTVVNGTVDAPGQTFEYTINVGQRTGFYFDSLTNRTDVNWRIDGPDGEVIRLRSFASNTQEFFLPVAGEYVLTVDGLLDATGDFSFRVAINDGATTIARGVPIANTFTDPLQTDIYQFEGVAGERLFVDVISAENNNANTSYRILSPTGERILLGSRLADAESQVLPIDGTYLLVVEGSSANTELLSYQLSVNTASGSELPLVVGQRTEGSISSAGAQQVYTFEVATYGAYYFDNRSIDTNLRWTLDGPSGAVVGGSQLTSASVVNLPPGEYDLTIDGLGESVGDFAFSLLALDTATEITPGTPVTGELSESLETVAFTFEGNVGERYAINIDNASDAASSQVVLIDPAGILVSRSRLNSFETSELLRSGAYTVLIEGVTVNDIADTFELNVVRVDTPAIPLLFNQTVSRPVTQLGEFQEFTFEVSDYGDYLFNAISEEEAAVWNLEGPKGLFGANQRFAVADGNSANPFLPDLAPGTYTLTVGSAADYSFELVEVSTATEIDYDAATSGQFTQSNQVDLYQFDVSAGDEVVIDFTAASDAASPDYRLLDPFGRQVVFSRALTTSAPLQLNIAGVYTLTVDGRIAADAADVIADTYTFAIGLQGNTPVVPIAGTALTLDTDVSGAIDVADETDVYLFEVTERTLVSFDSLTEQFRFIWSVFDDSGRLVAGRLTSDINASVLDLRPGNYRLEVAGTAGVTGDYTVRLNDLASATAITPGTAVAATLARPNQTDLYRFDANAGDKFYVDVLNTSDTRAASYRIVDQLGQNVARATTLSDLNTFEVPVTGTYTLLVEGAIANAGEDTYEIVLVPVPGDAESTTELELGEITSGTIVVQGETRMFTFDVPTYGGYIIDSFTSDRNLQFIIEDQAGTRVLSRAFTSLDSVDGEALQNLAPGSYTITVDGSVDFVGDFSFRFSSIADATVIEPGTITDVVLASGAETQAFRFEANEGDSFYFDVVDADPALNVWYSLVGPSGVRVFRSNRLRDFSTAPLTQTGSYTLLVEGRVNNEVSAAFQINVRPTGNPVTAAELGDRFTTPLTAGASATYELELAAEDRFVVDSLTTENVGVNFVVFDPLGVQLYSGNTSLDPPPFRAPLPGTYQVVLENTLDTDATVDFRLLSVNNLVVESGDVISSEFVEQNALSVHLLVSAGEEIVLRPIRDKQFTTAESFNRISQFLSTGQGGTEDGYLGISEALDSLEYRENAANNVVLVTDEDRDVVRTDVTFESLLQSFVEEDITLNVIVDGRFFDADGNRALGIISNDNTFVADGNGGFVEAPDGNLFTAVGREEYVDLAFTVNGAAWDLNQLRDGGTNAESFTQAFVDVSTRAIADRFGIDVIASNPNIDIENLTGVVRNVRPGDTVEFTIAFNNETADTFDLILVREGTGVVVGQLPVRIAGNYAYDAVAIDPDGDVVTYTLQSGPDGATIDSATGQIDWRPTETGRFEFEILAEDGNGGTAVQNYTVEVVSGRPNRQPVITSSPPRFVEVSNDYQYAVEANDSDGDPLQYFLTNSPDGLTIDRTTGLITWPADQVIGGSYNVAVRVIDGFGGEATQVYQLRVNTPPRFVSPARTGASPGLTYAYQTVVVDDDGDTLQYSIVSGPEGLTINQSGLVDWSPSIDDVGPVDVEILVTDRFGATVSQQFTINVQVDETLPTVTLTLDANPVSIDGVVNFQLQADDDIGIDSLTLTVDGQDVLLDVNNSGTFLFPVSGVFSAVATATDTSGNVAQDIVRVRVLDPSDTEGPVVTINSPLPGTEITYLTNVIGTVSDQNLVSYRLEVARADLVDLRLLASDDPDYQLIAEGFENVDTDLIGVFDPTLLANDAYIIRLIATDVNGLTTASAIQVNVVGDAKLGNLELGFTDLVTELDGITFRFDRNYSSLESATSGDFGFGWNLSLFNANIRESVPDAPPQFLGAGESPLRLDTRVYVTAPTGERLGFTFDPELGPIGLLGATYIPRFEGDPGVRWQLEVPETSTNANILQINPNGEARLNFVGSVYNPETYILVSPEGTRYTYQQHGGLVSVEDSSGNTINFDGDELVGSDGRSIRLIRDSQDRIVEIIDPDGVSLTYQYDANGDLIRFVNGEGQATTYEYLADPEHFLDSIYDDAGVRIFKSEFDDAGRLVSATDALGNTTSQSFDPGSFTGTLTDAAGSVTLLTYDSFGNITVEENPQGDRLQFFYDDPNNPSLVTREIDRRGFVLDSTFDENGNLLTLSELGTLADPFATPLTKIFTYSDANRLASVTNENGATTEFVYDDAGNLIRITNALGQFSTFTYDDQGRQIATTDFNGAETTFTFAAGEERPVRVTFGDGTYQEFEYNSIGQTTLERFVEANGTVVREVRNTFDQDFRNTSVAGAADALTTFIYDGELLQYEVTRTSVVSADVNTVSVRAYEHDDNQRVVRQLTTSFDYDRTADFQAQVEAALLTPESVVAQRYDVLGNRILLQDPSGNITTWVYDELERVVEERDALFNDGLTIEEALAARLVASGADTTTNTGAEHVRAFEYDANGFLVESIDQNGRRIEWTFDSQDRVTEERWYSATGALTDTQTFTYDLLGNLLTAADSDSRLTFGYDVLNQLTTVSNAGTQGAPTVVLTYSYDGEGNVISVVDNFGVTVESVYDVRNQLQTRLWFDANGNDVDDARVDYSYNALGQTVELSRYSSLDASTLVGSTNRTYTLDGFADTILHADGNGDLISSYDYDYNLAGFTTRETRDNRLTQFAQTIDYAFDPLGQLAEADYSVGTDEQYAYDANGNRVDSHLHGNVYRTGVGNRLATDGTFDYTHDGVGNIVAKTRLVTDADGNAGETTAYRYDQRNRLTGATLTAADGTTVLFEISYAYDAFGKRISRTENGATVYFVYNGVHVWADFNDSGEVTARYLHGDNTDEAIARFRTNGEGTAWYLGDALGTIRDLAGADGSQVNHTEYESFGRIISQLNEALADRYSFTGREYDDTLGLYYYRSRMFDPLAGQFNSNDQLGFSAGDTNLSRYVFNSPLQFTDPTGNTAAISYSVTLDIAFSDENLALTGAVAGFTHSTFSYLGYFFQTGSQAAALDRLTSDLSTLLSFDWAVKTVSLAGDVLNIPTKPLAQINTYINGVDAPPGTLQDLLKSEAEAQLSAFKAYEDYKNLSAISDQFENGPPKFDPQGKVGPGGGFINGARFFISILG